MPSVPDLPDYDSVPPHEMVGPLTLLLTLIRKHEVDVFDIPIAFITERYLAALEEMEDLDIEVGGEFVYLAAELLHIKVQLLMPRPKIDEVTGEEIDPRDELVGRLLSLKSFRTAADELLSLPLLGRDTFERGIGAEVDELQSPRPVLAAFDVYRLAHSLQRITQREQLWALYDLSNEGPSVREKLVQITDILSRRERVTLEDLLGDGNRIDIVITFVAMLEAVRMGLATISQAHTDGEIIIESTTTADESG